MAALLVAVAALLTGLAMTREDSIVTSRTTWPNQKGVVVSATPDVAGDTVFTYEYPQAAVHARDATRKRLSAGQAVSATELAAIPTIETATFTYSPAGQSRPDTATLLGLYPAGLDVKVYNNPLDPAERYIDPGGWYWFEVSKLNVLIAVCIFAALFLFFLSQAGRGRVLYLRRVAGLDALEEAIGRATEMGKPVLYVPGLADIDEAPTIASMVILGHVSGITAEYDTPIIVPCRFPVIMSVAEEAVRDSYIHANKADHFNPDNIRYLSSEQFAYTAAINGIMLRERPATNLYMGHFYAESLILVETGHYAGSIQVAGTDSVPQIPFFIAACDYTLIGEEFYAASAYLSRAPDVLSSIKAVDYFKALVLALIVVGCVVMTRWPDVMENLGLLFD